MENAIKRIRPNSIFEAYVPKTREQEDALAVMRDLSDELVRCDQYFAGTQNPLSDASLFVFSGGPGVGKTHLLESVLNRVMHEAPNVYRQCFLVREPLTHALIASSGEVRDYTFGADKSLIFIDDLYANKASIDQLNNVDVDVLMNFLFSVYERRMMVVTTSNFNFLGEILPLIQRRDAAGRITSRCAELLSRAAQIEIEGPDHRLELSRKAGARGGFGIAAATIPRTDGGSSAALLPEPD